MMMSTANISGNVAFDTNSLSKLKLAARENSPEAVKDVAKQFEAIFMNMMLKSMRDATPQDNPFDSEQSRTFTSMLDQQLSSNLASKGLGLADVLAKQLSKSSSAVSNAMQHAITDVGPGLLLAASLISNPLSPGTVYSPDTDKTKPMDSASITNKELNSQTYNAKSLSGDAGEFQRRMAEHAESASRATGMPAHLMLGQAALESGWGKREIKDINGISSNNLFGIKATNKWNGKVVETLTTEYVDGIKQKRIEKFRAYDSYAESFKDFANMMLNDPRYQNVLANLHSVKDYAQAMQKAGYATDPQYASKLANVIQKVSQS